MRRALAFAVVATLAAGSARADAITDLIDRQRAENARRPDGLTELDRRECYAAALAAGGTLQRQMAVEAACRDARRARRP